ncbi:MBOAT family protein [bacterium]|nr:MBOAT family protein [bacterium]
MDFFSFKFLAFLILTLLLFHLKPTRGARKWLLFAASLLFYVFLSGWCVVFLLITTAVAYFCALKNTKASCLAGVLLALFSLVFFKYTPFLYNSVAGLSGISSWSLKWLVPLGISFYTFRLVSYLTDVRRGELQAEGDFFYFFTYAAFFPLVICGPIQRAKDFLPALREPAGLTPDRFDRGIRQILWGLIKKAAVADNLAVLVNNVFSGYESKSGFVFILAVFLYSLQIYCDFSGYSDMAIGVARLFGIDLKENFRVPYVSSTIKEFWSRWHISLSTWFRDYVYFPMGGGRCGKLRRSFNIMVTFLLSGLWHGANWTFIVWGALHGLGLVAEKLLFPAKEGPKSKAARFVWALCTALLVLFGWLFFRSESLGQAAYILSNAFAGAGAPLVYFKAGFVSIMGEESGIVNVLRIAVPALVVLVAEFFARNKDFWSASGESGRKTNLLFYVAALILIFLCKAGEQQELIYGQF